MAPRHEEARVRGSEPPSDGAPSRRAPSAESPRPLRMGEVAPMVGVSVDTLRRWAAEGRLATVRSKGGQRLVAPAEVRRLVKQRREAAPERAIAKQSARNRFAGVVTRVERDGVAAVVEVQAGPHRLVSLLTAEAVVDMELKVGDRVVCVVKATNVMVEIPAAPDTRRTS